MEFVGLIFFIWLMYVVMKYVYKVVFRVNNLSSKSRNLLSYFAIKPFIGIFSFLFGGLNRSGLMGSFEEGRFLKNSNSGLTIDGQNKKLSLKDSFNHMGIIARSGAGKTTTYIIPNILKLAETKNSMIITDLSGDLFLQTSGYLAKKGFKIYILDPENLDESISYNPLYYASSSVAIDQISETLIRSANSGTIRAEDKVWLDGAKNLISIFIKVLIKTGEFKYINLANIKHLINNFGMDGRGLDGFMYKYADEKTFNEWKGFVSGNPKTVLSYVSTANTALNPIGVNDNLEKLTLNHSINFKNFRDEKSVLYIKIPAQKQEQYSFLLNLFYRQFFDSMMEELPKKQDLPIFCLLDEFGNMNIPNFSTTITTIRKYKVSISIVLQDYSQLEHKYGKNESHTIINGGIAGKLFYGGADLQITSMLTQMLGTKYVNQVDELGNLHHTKEPVLSNAEIRTMKDNEALFIFSNKLPIKMKIKPFYEDYLLKNQTEMKPYKSPKSQIAPKVEYLDLVQFND